MKLVHFTLKHGPWAHVQHCVADRLKYNTRISTKLLFSLEIQHVVELIYDATTEAVHQ
jgi:hypothetical protein